MEKRKELKIDLDELCSAMDDGSYEHEYFLDMETGEIVFLSEYLRDAETEKLRERIEDSDRYERIPRAESHTGYEDMRSFIATIEDEYLVETLEVAIDGRGAFSRFKNILLNYPEERERWFQFKDDQIQQRALEWLDDIGIMLAEE